MPHYATTPYSRRYQGAPDLLLPALGVALWWFSDRITRRQAAEQALIRERGWRVLIPQTFQDALREIDP